MPTKHSIIFIMLVTIIIKNATGIGTPKDLSKPKPILSKPQHDSPITKPKPLNASPVTKSKVPVITKVSSPISAKNDIFSKVKNQIESQKAKKSIVTTVSQDTSSMRDSITSIKSQLSKVTYTNRIVSPIIQNTEQDLRMILDPPKMVKAISHVTTQNSHKESPVVNGKVKFMSPTKSNSPIKKPNAQQVPAKKIDLGTKPIGAPNKIVTPQNNNSKLSKVNSALHEKNPFANKNTMNSGLLSKNLIKKSSSKESNRNQIPNFNQRLPDNKGDISVSSHSPSMNSDIPIDLARSSIDHVKNTLKASDSFMSDSSFLSRESIVIKSSVKLKNSKDEKKDVPFIIWEMGKVKKHPALYKKAQLYTFIKEMITKATSILKTYIDIDIDDVPVKKFTVGKKLACTFPITREFQIKSKFYMLANIFIPKNDRELETIARATYCEMDPRTQRSMGGMIELNIHHLITETASAAAKQDYVMSIVHETLHAFSFHMNQEKWFGPSTLIRSDHKNLFMLVQSGHTFFDGHWAGHMNPLDLMTPFEHSDSIITAPTLELIEHTSGSVFKGKRENLILDHFLDHLTSKQEFFDYKCNDDDELAKYPVFCTKKQSDNEYTSCSSDYKFKTFCDDSELLKNNCYRNLAVAEGSCATPWTSSEPFPGYEWEELGGDSRCFLSDKQTLCLRTAVEDSQVVIFIQGNKYICDESFKEVLFEYEEEGQVYLQKIICPDIRDFITNFQNTHCPENCNYNGFCSNGHCVCYEGFDAGTNCKTQSRSTNIELMFTEFLFDS